MHYIKLYFKLITTHLYVQLQYRFTFVVRFITYNLMPVIDFSILFIYFSNFDSLSGWNAWEVAIIYCITSSGFALTETFARGFDTFPYLVQNGSFDRMLLRPASTVFQVMASDFPFIRLTKVVYGIVFLIMAGMKLQLDLTYFQVLILVITILSCACMFTSLFVIMGAISFITIAPISIFHLFTDGTREVGKYPISVYPKWFARFYIFMIPIGCVTYFPTLYILGKPDIVFNTTSTVQIMAAFVGFLFVFVSFAIWNLCRRRYLSTGS